jgi:hypothetical protein
MQCFAKEDISLWDLLFQISWYDIKLDKHILESFMIYIFESLALKKKIATSNKFSTCNGGLKDDRLKTNNMPEK